MNFVLIMECVVICLQSQSEIGRKEVPHRDQIWVPSVAISGNLGVRVSSVGNPSSGVPYPLKQARTDQPATLCGVQFQRPKAPNQAGPDGIAFLFFIFC
jgi:hypothetical protein